MSDKLLKLIDEDKETLRKFRKKREEQYKDFEDRMTSDPSDTLVGPALATGSKLFRDIFIDPNAEPFDPSGAVGGTIKKVGARTARQLAEEASRSKDVVFSKVRQMFRDAHNTKVDNYLKNNVSEVNLSVIPVSQKKELAYLVATKQGDEAAALLKSLGQRSDDIGKKVAAQPSQKAAYPHLDKMKQAPSTKTPESESIVDMIMKNKKSP